MHATRYWVTYTSGAIETASRAEHQVNGVAKVAPLLIREKLAETAIAICYCLVGAHGLRGIHVLNAPFETLGHVL